MGSSGGIKDGSVEADGDELSVGDSVAVIEGLGVVDADTLSLGVSVGDTERDPVSVAVRVVLGVTDGLMLVDALAVCDADGLGLPVGVGEGYTAHSSAPVVSSLHTLTCKRPGALVHVARRAVVEELQGYGQVATQWLLLMPFIPLLYTICHHACLSIPAVPRACRVSQTGTSGDKNVPTFPVSTAKSHIFLTEVCEMVVLAVRSVEPTRCAPVSSYKPTSQEVAGWSVGISRLKRRNRV